MSRSPTYAGGARSRYLLLASALFLVLMGLVMVYSASSVSDLVKRGDAELHLKKHAISILLGAVALAAAQRIDYRMIKRWTWSLYGACVAALVAVLLVGVGANGARSWIDLGPTTIQPSEYAKLACILVVALLFAQLKEGRLTTTAFWGRLALACGVVALLVMLQPDMGTTASIVLAVYFMLLLGGTSLAVLGSVAAVGGAAAVALMYGAAYRVDRITAFIDPWSDPQGIGYQSIQSMLAFGSGGLTGVGLGMSRQKFFYLPEAHNDFIFAIIGEELGLVGTLAVVAAFIVFAWAGIRIALGTRDTFGRLLAAGLTTVLVGQALMNMAAVTSLTPVTGIPMPLVSYGGTAMTFALTCVGIILSVSSHGHSPVRGVRASTTTEEKPRARDDERRGNGRPRLSRTGSGRAAARRRA